MLNRAGHATAGDGRKNLKDWGCSMTTGTRQDATAAPEEVQRFNEQIDPYLDFLRSTPTKLARLIEHIRRELVRIESEQDDSVKAKRVEILREQGNDRLSELLLTVYSVQESIEGLLSRSGRPPERPPATTEAAILQEIREWRAWNRAQRLLDAGINPMEVIAELAGDRNALRALKAELPAYLKSHGQGDRAAEVLAAIDAAGTTLPAELLARVDAVRAEYERGWSRLRQAIQSAEHELNGNWGAVAAIPDWVEGGTITLATLADYYRSIHNANDSANTGEQPLRNGTE